MSPFRKSKKLEWIDKPWKEPNCLKHDAVGLFPDIWKGPRNIKENDQSVNYTDMLTVQDGFCDTIGL